MYRLTAIILLAALPSTIAGRLPAPLSDSLRNESIKEVEVKAGRVHALSDHRKGRLYWKMESLAEMPHVLGSADPLRCLQLLPGVATNNDYTSGIHIQGCSPSQSIVHLDGAPVFNASHLLGLFSVFNASHFRGMALVGNRHDASFGNRLGGEVSFHPIDTIAREIHLDATVSFMESEGTLTLPAGPRSTLYLSGRGSYLNLLYGKLLVIDDMQTRYGLQDYNLTFVHQAGPSDNLRISLYHGTDRMTLTDRDFGDKNRIGWENTAASVHWLHHADRLILHQSATFSRYHNTLALKMGALAAHSSAAITQASYRNTAEWSEGRLQWSAGVEYDFYSLCPMKTGISGSFTHNTAAHIREEAHEAGIHIQTDTELSRHWSVQGGLRLSAYHSHGSTFFSPSPRLTVSYTPDPPHTLALHYGFYQQHLHQMAVSHGGFPIDYWISSSSDIRPQQAHSLALSYCFLSRNGLLEFNAELYYKKLNRQHEYFGSVLDIFTQTSRPEQDIIHGKGRNYGINLMLKKNKGRLTGWIAYATGKSIRCFPALSRDEWFNSSFDRRHDLSVVSNYRIDRHWSIGGDFVYAGGNPFTPTRSIYAINNNIVGEYGKYNSARLPATHRMDMALTYRFTPRRGREQSVNLSVYNLYARRNILFSYLSVEKNTLGYRHVYSLCRVLPSVGYTLKF